MTLEIGQTTAAEAGSRKERSRQLVATVCGIAVGGALLAGIVGWQRPRYSNTDRTGSVPAHVVTIDADAIASRSQLFTFYLIGSQAQADLVESQLQASEAKAGDAPAAPKHLTVVVSTPEEEAVVYGAAAAAYDLDTTVPIHQIIDLRTS